MNARFRRAHAHPVLFVTDLARKTNAGPADREVPSTTGPTARNDGDLQRKVLHVLQSSADVQGGAGLLPQSRRYSSGRKQSCSAGFHLVGTVETTQVSKNRCPGCLNEWMKNEKNKNN